MRSQVQVGVVYRLRGKQGQEPGELYFVRRPLGGYAVFSNVNKEDIVEYTDYWESALKKLKDSGYEFSIDDVVCECSDEGEERDVEYYYSKTKKILFRSFYFFVFLYALSFILGINDLRGVSGIDPKVLKDPIQEELKKESKISFSRAGYAYELTPKFNYDISGLLVHTFEYDKWYSISKKDVTIPIDLCMIWGDNVKNGVHRDRNSTFDQDMRFCWWRGSGAMFSNDEISNNHIVVNNDEFISQLNSLRAGDQIRMVGKLVDIKATPLTTGKGYEDYETSFATSTTRSDTGAGACEVIFLEKLEILRSNNSFSGYLKNFALFAMALIIFLRLSSILFVKLMKKNKQVSTS